MSRIVWFHPRVLLPPRSGGELRVTGLAREVAAAGHDVLVIAPGDHDASSDGFKVHGVELRRSAGRALAKVVSTFPLRSARVTQTARRRARAEIAAFAPDLAIVSDALSWSVARDLIGPVPMIHDAHNVESDLYDELASNASGLVDRLTFAIDRRRVERSERTLINRADIVVAVSAEDAMRFGERFGRTGVVVVPSSVVQPGQLPSPSSSPVMLFVGTLDYPPNVAAVRELVEGVLPVVRQAIPAAQLVVAGRHPTSEVRRLVTNPGVAFHEDLPDLSGLYATAGCVALPIRSGGGSRLKVYEALAHGLPVVGTERALSGIPLVPGSAVHAESAADIASGVVAVLSDPVRAEELGRAARAHFERELSWAQAVRPLLDAIDRLAG